MYFLYSCTSSFCIESRLVKKYISPIRIFQRDVLCTFRTPYLQESGAYPENVCSSDPIPATRLRFDHKNPFILQLLSREQPAVSSTSSGSSCNISEDSILKTDSDNEEVEREQKAKKRRFFFSLLTICQKATTVVSIQFAFLVIPRRPIDAYILSDATCAAIRRETSSFFFCQ